MAFLTDEADALPLARILVSEAIDPSLPFDKDRRDAYEELLRQVAGHMATAARPLAGAEVEIKHTGGDPPDWPGASRLGLHITGEKLPPIRFAVVLSKELTEPRDLPVDADPPPGASSAAPAPPTPNLNLVLDVTLDATIRFGQKQMLLREVLELHPGVAIALDRKVEEPVELLIGGRMVARGEVVIVDGNYGLRVTEIVSPQQRIDSLRGASS
jgi:flagellar motor switch protein FliN